MKDIKQLIVDLRNDEDLRTRLAGAAEDESAIDSILANEGYAVTVADMREYAQQKNDQSPSDEELRKVAGGTSSSVETVSEVTSAVVGFGASCWMPY